MPLRIPADWDPNDTVIRLTVLSRDGPVPLYRCPGGSRHIDTIDPGCEAASYSRGVDECRLGVCAMARTA
jgi:hypothetical protein